MNIFDTHSDTPFDLYRGNLDLYNGKTNVTLGKAESFGKKIFVSAFYSDRLKSDGDCYREFIQSSQYYDGLMEKHSDVAMICRNGDDIRKCTENGKFGAIKAIEDIRILEGDIERLDTLYSMGIRHILPVWGGESHVGGAWDTERGLTDFGKAVVKRCGELGIVADVSHMSVKSFWDTAESTDKPLVASHSDYKDISPHGRNLDKSQLLEIIRRGGIVGLNLCKAHVSAAFSDRDVTTDDDFIGDALRHVYYCLENGGEKTVCLGCDWDGTKMTPQIRDVSDVARLYERLLADGISGSVAEDIFFNNAYNFYIKNL